MIKKNTYRWLAIFSLLFLSMTELSAQADIINNVRDAIKIGASKEVSKFLNTSVDLTINGDMETYSRTQAEYVLKDFFKANPPASFVIVHQGASKAGSPYATGQYTSGSDTYLVWLRIKKISSQYLIHEMSFIKE